MSQGKSDLPDILQRKDEEFNGYLRKLKEKIDEIDLVINEIDGKVKRGNYKLTEEEKDEVERLLMDVEAKSRQAKNYFEVAEKTLKSFYSDVESYRSEQGVSGWNVLSWGAAGAGLGALGAAFFFPVLAPVVAGTAGGGVLASVGRILYGPDLNSALLFGASVGLAVSGLVLCLQFKRCYATRNFCNKLCSIIQNYSDEVNEMKRLLNQSRWM